MPTLNWALRNWLPGILFRAFFWILGLAGVDWFSDTGSFYFVLSSLVDFVIPYCEAVRASKYGTKDDRPLPVTIGFMDARMGRMMTIVTALVMTSALRPAQPLPTLTPSPTPSSDPCPRGSTGTMIRGLAT